MSCIMLSSTPSVGEPNGPHQRARSEAASQRDVKDPPNPRPFSLGEFALLLLAGALLLDFTLGHRAAASRQDGSLQPRTEEVPTTPRDWQHFGYDSRMSSGH